MREHILFLTGHLARPRLEKVLAGLGDAGFDWSIFDVGVKVAALMTEAIITRRLPRPVKANRILVPGRCRADLDHLAAEFGLPFERGPDELKDLPAYFGKGRGLDLSRHDIRIFAEIVDASALPVDAILARARAMRQAGADVIDLGCLPDTPFRASRGCGQGAESGRVLRQRRLGCDRRARARRAGGRRLPAQPDRAHARSRSRHQRNADPHSGRAGRPAVAAARRRGSAPARDRGDPRSGPRPDPFRLHGFAAALCRIAPRPARGGDPHGDRKPDRAHRCGLGRRHRRARRHLLGAAHPQRAGGAGEPAYAAHHRGARCGAAHDVRGARGPQPAARLRRRAAAAARPQAVPQYGRGDRRARARR